MNNHLLYLKIKNDLLQKIEKMEKDERLPSRTKLIEEYNVTRSTIDRAISELIGEGYLYSRDGSGTYILQNKEASIDASVFTAASWGVVLPDIMHDTYPGILRGVEDIANKYGRSTIICNTDNDMKKQADYINKLIDNNAEGLVIVPAVTKENDLQPFKRLQEKKIPFIFCNRGVNGIEAPKVVSNNFHGGYIATKHLIECGYTKIAYISHSVYSTPVERYQGYLSALTEAGLEINEERIVFEPTDVKRRGYESTKKLLEGRLDKSGGDLAEGRHKTEKNIPEDRLSESGGNHERLDCKMGKKQPEDRLSESGGNHERLDCKMRKKQPEDRLSESSGNPDGLDYKMGKKLLESSGSLIDAIFCFNDTTAKGAYEAIVDAGLTPGKDIGLVGYDNTSICESLPVKLTTVRFNAYEIGTKAAELLIAITKDGLRIPETKMIILQPELVIRESCGYNPC